MDVKTPALDRVLEALAPALAAELDRLVQETRENLEQEFQLRLQAALGEAQMTASARAQAELERAIEEAREEVLARASSQFEQEFNEKLQAGAAQARSEAAEEREKLEAAAAQLRGEWSVERARLEREIEKWRLFAEIQRQLADASSQQEILSRFLMSAEVFADGLAIYVRKPDGLALWKSKGRSGFPDIISKDTTDPEWYFRPIAVRGQTVGAIYAAPSFDPEAIEFLVASLERALEIYGLKLRAPASKAVAS